MQITQDGTEARWARFSNFRSVDLLNLRPHHRTRTLTANPAPFYTAWAETGQMRVLFNMEPEAVPWLGAPTIFDYLKTDEQRAVLTFFSGNTQLGRPLMAPPGVPADRVEALRQAFDATMREPAFLKEAESMGFEVVPQSGERIAALVATALATPKDIVRLAERATQGE